MALHDDERVAYWLRLWQDVTGSRRELRDPDSLTGVLNDLRHDDDKLTALFEPFPHGLKVLARVQECVAHENDPARPYVSPKPRDTTDDELLALLQDATDRAAACGHPVPGPLRVLRDQPSTHTAPLSERLGDAFIQQRGVVAELLWSTVYHLTASAPVRNYILTPTFMSFRKHDPYAPQFELWVRGAEAVSTWGDLGEGAAVLAAR